MGINYFGGFHNSWINYFMENPSVLYKWMRMDDISMDDDWGYPHDLGNLHHLGIIGLEWRSGRGSSPAILSVIVLDAFHSIMGVSRLRPPKTDTCEVLSKEHQTKSGLWNPLDMYFAVLICSGPGCLNQQPPPHLALQCWALHVPSQPSRGGGMSMRIKVMHVVTSQTAVKIPQEGT